MSTIAWDGDVLAADKAATSVGVLSPVSKIHSCRYGLTAVSGDLARGLQVVGWLGSERLDPAQYPKGQDHDDFATVWLIDRDLTLWTFERLSQPFARLGAKHAMGSGRDFALAAMHLGKDAVEAVAVANVFDINSGLGIQSMKISFPGDYKPVPTWFIK